MCPIRRGFGLATRLSGDGDLSSWVYGSRVLPDVGHLELARAAVAAAAGSGATEVELEQVEWLCPVVVGSDGLELRVELFAEGDGRSGYEITSVGADGEVWSTARASRLWRGLKNRSERSPRRGRTARQRRRRISAQRQRQAKTPLTRF